MINMAINMKKLFLIMSALVVAAVGMTAQTPESNGVHPDLSFGDGQGLLEESLMLRINDMSPERQGYVNEMASLYRGQNRGFIADMGRSMLSGGVTAVVNVISEEIIKLTKIRSVQKKKWQAMRNNECVFVDSLESIKGQSDFYSRCSDYGPLDPSDMRFDGITFTSKRNGFEVLRIVCSLDTARLDRMFMHSKFYLVLDSLAFYPYRSYLPNLSANRIKANPENMRPAEREYYEAINMFSYDELGSPTIKLTMDLTSSWINEQVQVYQDVKLGSFTLDFEIPESAVDDSVYVYSRQSALASGESPIVMNGDSFVVPRSYMPGQIDNPSWGTGEYKIKIVLSQKARINPNGSRSKNWHRDYRKLVRLQNGGKASNDYWQDIKTAFVDKSGVIMKATYTPLLNYGVKAVMSLTESDANDSPKK